VVSLVVVRTSSRVLRHSGSRLERLGFALPGIGEEFPSFAKFITAEPDAFTMHVWNGLGIGQDWVALPGANRSVGTSFLTDLGIDPSREVGIKIYT
jgi:hypothetical protein